MLNEEIGIRGAALWWWYNGEREERQPRFTTSQWEGIFSLLNKKCSLKSHSRDENIKLHADTAVRMCCLAQDVTFGTRHQMVTQNALWPQSKITPYIKEQDSYSVCWTLFIQKKINLENKFPVHHYLVILMGTEWEWGLLWQVCCFIFYILTVILNQNSFIGRRSIWDYPAAMRGARKMEAAYFFVHCAIGIANIHLLCLSFNSINLKLLSFFFPPTFYQNTRFSCAILLKWQRKMKGSSWSGLLRVWKVRRIMLF